MPAALTESRPVFGTASPAQRFWAKVGLMGLLLALTGLVPFYSPIYHAHPFSMVLNKDRLLAQAAPPRLIIVGGSGAFAALDSAAAEARLGKTTVNLAFFAGFGILPYLDPLLARLAAGDTVVLMPEYSVMKVGLAATHRARPWLLALYPGQTLGKEYSRSLEGLALTGGDVVELLRSKFAGLVKLSFTLDMRPGFRKAGREMDSRGDLTEAGQFRRVPEAELLGRGSTAPSAAELARSLDEINAFSRAARRKGASVYFAWPAYAAPEIAAQGAAFAALERFVKDRLEIPVLGTPWDFAYPYRRFTNSVEHLDAEGKKARTARLLTLLEKSAP